MGKRSNNGFIAKAMALSIGAHAALLGISQSSMPYFSHTHPTKDALLEVVETDFQDGSLDSMSYTDFLLQIEASEINNWKAYHSAQKRVENLGVANAESLGDYIGGESFLTDNLLFDFGNCEGIAKKEIAFYEKNGVPKKSLDDVTEGTPKLQFLNMIRDGKLVPHVRLIYETTGGYTSFEEDEIKEENSVIAPLEILVAGWLKDNGKSYPKEYDKYFEEIETSRTFADTNSNSILSLPSTAGAYNSSENNTDPEESIKEKERWKELYHQANTVGKLGLPYEFNYLSPDGEWQTAFAFQGDTLPLARDLLIVSEKLTRQDKKSGSEQRMKYTSILQALKALDGHTEPHREEVVLFKNFLERKRSKIEESYDSSLRRKLNTDSDLAQITYTEAMYMESRLEELDGWPLYPVVKAEITGWNKESRNAVNNASNAFGYTWRDITMSLFSEEVAQGSKREALRTLRSFEGVIFENSVLTYTANFPYEEASFDDEDKNRKFKIHSLWNRGDIANSLRAIPDDLQVEYLFILQDRKKIPDKVQEGDQEVITQLTRLNTLAKKNDNRVLEFYTGTMLDGTLDSYPPMNNNTIVARSILEELGEKK